MGKDYLFSNKRRSFFRSKWLYIALIAVFVFGIWMNGDDSEKERNNGDNLAANAAISSEERNNQDKYSSGNYAGNNTENQFKDNDDKSGKTNVITQGSDAYYILMESKGQIELHYCDGDGSVTFLKVTDIPYTLISPNDQLLFKEGVIVKSETELNRILQDFES